MKIFATRALTLLLLAAATRNDGAKTAPAATPTAHPLDAIYVPAGLVAPVDLPLALMMGGHVVFIGNGLLEQMQEHGWFETMMIQRFSADDLVLRTLAWSADEVNLMPRPDEFVLPLPTGHAAARGVWLVSQHQPVGHRVRPVGLASRQLPVFAAAVHSLNAPYPDIHLSAGQYFPADSGTCGQDFVASEHL